MKYRFLAFLLPVLLLLASCSSERNFSKRKYLPGFFSDRVGDRKEQISYSSEKENQLQGETADYSDALADADTLADLPVEKKSAEEIKQKIPVKKTVADSSRNSDLPGISSEEPEPDLKEKKIINRAFYEAIAAVALFLLGVTALLLLPEILTGLSILLLAFIFSGAGMVDAKKVRKMHDKGEDYPGKNKVVFARVIGITGLVLIGLAVAFILFVLAVLTL